MNEREKDIARFLEIEDALAHREPHSLDEIDATDTLDRIPYLQTLETLRKWNGYLRDGGTLRLSVCDFDEVVEVYTKGGGDPEPMLCGPRGMTQAVFNRRKIAEVLNMAGFEIVGGGEGSLNWKENRGRISVTVKKRSRPDPTLPLNVHAIMSLPRIAWTDTFAHILDTVAHLGMPFTKSTGVFWGQCLQRLMEGVVREGKSKYILTIDYDSIFDARDVLRLWQVMEENPDIAALCPLQIGRDRDSCLVQFVNPDGTNRREIMSNELFAEALDIKNGHFGATLIRCDAIAKIPKPWFLGEPNSEGRWEDGRVDDDIYFWHKVREHGGRVAVCPKVRIGHLQCIISWPADDLSVRHQYLSKYHEDGRPEECSTY